MHCFFNNKIVQWLFMLNDRTVVSFLIRRVILQHFHVHTYVSNTIHTYVLPCPYVFYTYMFRVSNSYELELPLPRMHVPLTSIVKIFPKVRNCFRFCSHSDSKIRQGWMQKFMWEVLNFSSVLFWEFHAPRLLQSDTMGLFGSYF